MALLRRGSKGPGVENVQTALNKHAKARLKADGIFGSKTDKAVRQHQEKAKLSVDGLVGPKTAKSLKMSSKDLAPKEKKPKEKKPVKLKKVGVSYTVPIYRQHTAMSCWAVAIAMMVSWKKRMTIPPEHIADVLGYTKEFKSKGMHPEDAKVFSTWGMRWQAPMCYTVHGFADMMKRRGPIWIAGKARAPHVRVLSTIKGDGTPEKTWFTVNDPSGGRVYTQRFDGVMGAMEDLDNNEEISVMKKPIFVAHL